MAVVTVAAVGVAASAASAAVSFKQAAEQKRLAKEADDAAAKAMKDAKAKAETDYYEGLGVPLDAYEAEFESNLAVQKQNVEALQEGDARALAAGVGRVGAQSQAAAEETRIAMGDEISNLEKMKADSKENINQQLIEMDVAAAKEQNQRSREASAARAAAISSGISAVGSAVEGLGAMAPLYSKSRADKRASKLGEQYNITDKKQIAELGEMDFSRKDMKQIKKNPDSFWDKLTPDQRYRFGIEDYKFSD